jgi:ABC-2 type transport system ATP-binding protein
MIEVQGLTKRYGDTLAVDDLGFTVRPGRVTGFLGPNGSGKSTTLRMILGLATPDAGRALIGGRTYAELGWPLREVGALLDAGDVHPGLTAEHHLLALARANALDRSRVAEVLDVVGLASAARKRTGTFSLGMGQRLGIAAALLGDPAVVLFDEPTNGLDPDGIRWFRHLARGLAAEGRTVLLSSHLLGEAALTVDHLVVIGRGRLIDELSMDELAARSPARVRVRAAAGDLPRLAGALRAAGMAVAEDADGALTVSGGPGAGAGAEEVAGLAAAAGVVLHELSPQRASLEDVFMELTHDRAEYLAITPATTPGPTTTPSPTPTTRSGS